MPSSLGVTSAAGAGAAVEVAVAALQVTTTLGGESVVCRFALEGEGIKFVVFGCDHRLRRSAYNTSFAENMDETR
jgi:hypothetical protein